MCLFVCVCYFVKKLEILTKSCASERLVRVIRNAADSFQINGEIDMLKYYVLGYVLVIAK